MKRQSTRKPAAQNGPPAPTAARACLARILRQNCVLSGRCSLYESTVRQYRLMFPKLAKPRAENFDLSALDSCRMSPGPGLNVRSLQVGRLPAISPEARGAPCPRSPIKYPPDEESEPQLTDRAQKVPGGVRGSEICDLLLRSPQPQRKKNVSLGNLFGRVPQSVVPWRGKVAKNRVNRDQRRYGDNVHLTTIMCPISIGEMKVTPLLETAPISHSPTPVPSHYLPLKKSSVRLSKPSASFQTLSVVPPAIDDLDDPKTTISGIESVVEEGKCCARLKPPMAESGAHHQNSSVNLHISKEDDEDQIILDDMLAEEADADSPIGKEAVNQTVPQKEQVTNGITPINLEEEEKRFFSSNCAVNPTFAYEGRKCRMRIMRLFQRPSGTLLPLAEKILDSFIATYGSESRYLDEFGGDILSMEETKSIFQKYIDDLGLGSYIALRFSHNTVSPTSIAHSSKNSVSVVTIGLPIEYRRNRITGVLNHEIGTHFIRKFNDRLQPWHKSRGKFRLKRYTATEEGLASLNQLHDTATNPKLRPLLFKPALYYYACCRSEMSFAELYGDLGKYIDNPKRRFKMCLRVKRGLEDTSQRGGLYKDKAYFEGAVKILQKRKLIDMSCLFSGKISLDDALKPEIRGKICTAGTMYPRFLDDKEKYMRALDRIAEVNGI